MNCSERSKAPSIEWDDAANATPLSDVEAAITAVYGQCGLSELRSSIVEQHRLWLAETGRDAVAAIWFANRVAAASPSPEDPPDEVTTRQKRESWSRSC